MFVRSYFRIGNCLGESMLRTFQFNLPTTSKSIGELINYEVDRCKVVLLQTPMANTGTVYFGENGREFAYLLNGAAASLDVTNLRDIFVKGLIADKLIVVVS